MKIVLLLFYNGGGGGSATLIRGAGRVPYVYYAWPHERYISHAVLNLFVYHSRHNFYVSASLYKHSMFTIFLYLCHIVSFFASVSKHSMFAHFLYFCHIISFCTSVSKPSMFTLFLYLCNIVSFSASLSKPSMFTLFQYLCHIVSGILIRCSRLQYSMFALDFCINLEGSSFFVFLHL